MCVYVQDMNKKTQDHCQWKFDRQYSGGSRCASKINIPDKEKKKLKKQAQANLTE